MATAKQRANRTTFGVHYGKRRSNADAQMKRETARIKKYKTK